jgi:hypothetical protein
VRHYLLTSNFQHKLLAVAAELFAGKLGDVDLVDADVEVLEVLDVEVLEVLDVEVLDVEVEVIDAEVEVLVEVLDVEVEVIDVEVEVVAAAECWFCSHGQAQQALCAGLCCLLGISSTYAAEIGLLPAAL